jgi:hypothetical protein
LGLPGWIAQWNERKQRTNRKTKTDLYWTPFEGFLSDKDKFTLKASLCEALSLLHMLELNVHNETSRLRAVVLGLANNNGPTPTVEEAYDPKSLYYSRYISNRKI